MRTAWAVLALAVLSQPAAAQWFPWADDAFGDRRGGRYDRRPFGASPESPYDRRQLVAPPESRPPTRSDLTQEGGPRPVITPQAPQVVSFSHDYPAASIVIDTSARRLYYVLPEGRAYAYPISVGREGFNWTGSETISRKQEWPDWHPPEEMRQRDPTLPQKMTGGIRNPLGARALYLWQDNKDTLYRIHGTNEPWTIGHSVSSGCIRMLNQDVIDLYERAPAGAKVVVLGSRVG